MERFFDVFLSGFAIIFFTPILVPIMVLLKLTGEGEIFFKQSRVGKDKVPFQLLKFVTMLKNSENMGHGLLTVRDDYRVLPFGKFLRKTKINELAQLISIIKGDMSIVGPRPLIYNPYSEGIGEKIYTLIRNRVEELQIVKLPFILHNYKKG